jgi:hypothetical protein
MRLMDPTHQRPEHELCSRQVMNQAAALIPCQMFYGDVNAASRPL